MNLDSVLAMYPQLAELLEKKKGGPPRLEQEPSVLFPDAHPGAFVDSVDRDEGAAELMLPDGRVLPTYGDVSGLREGGFVGGAPPADDTATRRRRMSQDDDGGDVDLMDILPLLQRGR